MEDSETTFTESSGNVFADLGLSDPETRMAKVYLGVEIARIIKARKWSQTQAAAELCLDQPSISKILALKLRGFSIERLMELLSRLDRDIIITIQPSELAGHGRIVVRGAGNAPSPAQGS
jgi:predicted XRE-type DNA-binding protein